jgi:transcriptional regulator with XRE-family HTH domain
VDVSFLIRHRLKELGLEPKDLAAAAQVTESYISQLLARKKAPPSPGRTDIYEKIGRALELPSGELSKLAELEREEELRKRVGEPARPPFAQAGLQQHFLIGQVGSVALEHTTLWPNSVLFVPTISRMSRTVS